MTQRLSLNSFRCVSLWLACCLASAAWAQEVKNTYTPAPSIAAAASVEQARFLADNEVTQLRLEVFSLGDARLYDSEFKAGNLLDWNWQDAQGQRLADGAYRCVVTVKDLTGHATQRQGLLLVQNGTASWQAPEQAETALRNTAAARTAEGMAYFATVTNPSELAAAVLAHDGKDARLMTGSGGLSVRSGNFLKGDDEERMKLHADGKLEVKGLIQTNEGIVFPDGTVQKTALVASGQTIKQIAEDGKPVKASPNAPAVGGSGTPNKLLKWAANGVDAQDSVVTDLGPGGGISVNGSILSTFFNTSASATEFVMWPAITGHSFLLRSSDFSAAGGSLFVGNTGNVGLRSTNPASRLATGGNATIGAALYNTAAPPNGLLVEGNVGIGNSNPVAKLDVNGVVRVRGNGDILGEINLSAHTGLGDFIVYAGVPGAGIRRMTVTNNGKVGIGTATPLMMLDVSATPTTASSVAIQGVSSATDGFGVIGTANQGSNAFGVYGTSIQGTGVYGWSNSSTSTAAAVVAESNTVSGNALRIMRGRIKVDNAGIGTNTPVFIHQVTAANTPITASIIDHPLCNNNPNAILIVTLNTAPGGVDTAVETRTIQVFYSIGNNRWHIAPTTSLATKLLVNSHWNILVVNP